MAEETVTLTAQLKDQMSAPLEKARDKVDGFTDAVVTGAKKQAAATDRSTAQIDGNLRKQSRLFGGMNGPIGRATTGASRLFDTMRTRIGRSMDRIAKESREKGEKSGNAFSSGLKGAVTAGLATLSVASLGAFANSAVGSFSELEDSSAAAGVVFGKNMDAIIQQSLTGADKLGLSQQAVINGANTFGTYGKAAGLAGKDLSGFATGLTGLAGDMASFKGTTTEQALEAIAAGLRGEAEPLRAYGVMLDDVQMRDEALRMGLIKTTKDALTPQQKVLAAQSLIFKQTTDAQGDFARTSDSTANTAKRLSAASENLSAKIGSLLAPAFTAVRTKILGAVSGMSGFIDKIMAAQEVMVGGGSRMDVGRALGLSDDTLTRIFAVTDAIGAVAQKIWDMRVPIIIIAGLILSLFIPHWVALGVAALLSAGKQALAWLIARQAATRAAIIHSGAVMAMIGGWVLMGTQATINAAKIAAAWLVALGPVGWVILAVAAVVAGLVWAYNNVEWFRAGVDAAFAWIGQAARNVADWVVGAFNNIVSFWNTHVMPVLTFLGSVFAAIFDWIGRLVWNFATIAVALFLMLVDFWNGVLLPAIQAVGSFFQTIFEWLWTNVLQPVIGFIVGAFQGLVDFWNGTLKPVVDTVGQWFSDIIGGAIEGLTPVIDGIKKGFEGFISFWTATLKPVVDTIGGAFKNLGDIIKPVADSIGSFLSNPLGGIQDMLGIAKDGNGQGVMPSNSGGGVYAGNGVRFAGGGVLGGYAPGRDSILARLSPGESVLVPELTRAIGPQNIMAANAAASGGRPAGSGPSLTAGYSTPNASGGGTSVAIAAGAVQVTVQAGPDGITPKGMAQIQAAFTAMLEDAVKNDTRRSY